MKNALVVLVIAAAAFFAYRQLGNRAASRIAPPAAETPKGPPPPEKNPPLIDSLLGSLGGASGAARLKDELAKGADPNSIDVHGRTALSIAVRNNDVPALEVLLEKGADPNKRDREMGWTPLMNAAFLAAREPRYLKAIEVLLAHGADPNVAKDGTTPLQVAVNNIDAKAKDAAVVELLLKAGARPDGAPPASPGAFAMTPLSLAAWNGKTAAALALARGGANLEAPVAGGKTPAQTARDYKHPELAGALEKIARERAPKAPAQPKKGLLQKKKHR